MSEETGQSVPSTSRCYAFVDSDGTIDLESLSETAEGVKKLILRECVELQWEHRDKGNLAAVWQDILKRGKVVPVLIHVLEA